jgi:penicillin-binding protein 1C
MKRLLLALLPLAALALVRALPLPERLRQPPSTVVRWSDGSPAHVFLSPDDKVRIAADLRRVDPAYVRALLRYEDKRFMAHAGVDPVAIARAAALNAMRGHVASGGSTLTMQLVRVLEPRPRTLRSKIVEALRAVQLETRLSKDGILRSYLTFAPYGRNVEGVEAASLAYFGHGAEHLSPAEIATLLAVPQRPNERMPSEANAVALRSARDAIASQLVVAGALDGGGAGDAPPVALRPIPREIPHAATWLRDAHPGVVDLTTTLDRRVQRVAEAQLARVRDDLARQGAHDGTLVVVEHATGQVRALAGNFDFFDARQGSQVAGFAVTRSPGSTLKPFLHAMAIDQGLALPDTLVTDVPIAYGSYAPENYSGTFSGLVPLREALAWSLNVPFVDLLSKLGVERFVATLRGAGVTSLDGRPGAYGLSAAVGGVEITPLELASLYAALAEDGRVRPLRVLADEPAREPLPLMSAGAAWMTRRVLSQRDRPDFPMRRQFSAAPSHVHWKTGTSQGHRDAWACGSGPKYTCVAWLGNFDRTPSAALVGSEASAPLLFDVLEGIAEPERFPRADPAPADLASVDVCSYSGRVPGPACTDVRRAWAVRDHVPSEPCAFHVAMDVDLDSGLALNPSCREGRRWERRAFLTWPSGVRRFLSAQDRSVPRPPSLMTGCEPAGTRRDPAIVSPPAGQIVVLVPGVPADSQQVPLLAESFASGARHAWFVDGAYLGDAAPEESEWWTPSPGTHEVVVVDDAGRSARRRLEVRDVIR